MVHVADMISDDRPVEANRLWRERAMDFFGLLVMTAAYGAFVKWLPDVEVGWRNALIGGGGASLCSLLAGI